jgi:uncharacterized membrane protein YdjX (TVP38/TMEM64 family)
MTRYWTITGLLLFFFLGTFLLVEQLNLSFLTDPHAALNARSVSAALAGIGLLIADVILPVPSSLVMIANGALFGFALGTFLSLIGNLGAALTGFFIGRRGEPLLARFVPPEEHIRANHLLAKWGLLAIIITRPVPILAETTIIMAGASTMKLKPMILAALTGSLPIALLYALIGATAASFNNTMLAFGLTLLMAGLFWILGRRL